MSTALIRERLEPALAMVQNLISVELAYINTSHPDFVRASSASALLSSKIHEFHRSEDSSELHVLGDAQRESSRKKVCLTRY